MAGSERDYVLIGLMGEGIGQSLSPLLHQREADRQGIRLIYTIIDSDPLSLTAADLPESAPVGADARLPRTQCHPSVQTSGRRHLDELSEEACVLGAVNTVVFENGTSPVTTPTGPASDEFERSLPTHPGIGWRNSARVELGPLSPMPCSAWVRAT